MLNLIEELLDGFAYLESLAMAHRNIKPSSILISDEGSPVISDFKYSCFQSTKYVQKSDSFDYSSPALVKYYILRFNKVQHDPLKSDVYSLGMTFLAIARTK